MHTLPHWERPRTARPPAPRGLGLRELPLSRVVVPVLTRKMSSHWACRDRARRAHPTPRKPRTARPPAPRGLGLRELPLSRVVVRIRVTRGLHSSGPGRTVAHCATWPPPGGVPPCPARRARSRPLPLGQHTVSMCIQTPGTRPRAALPRLRGRSNRAGPGEAAAEPDGGERAASGGLRRPPAAARSNSGGSGRRQRPPLPLVRRQQQRSSSSSPGQQRQQ
jgi:hypothetical protein